MANEFKCNIKEIEKYRDSLKSIREEFKEINIEIDKGKGKTAEAIEKDLLQIETNKETIIANLEKYENAITKLIDILSEKVTFSNSENFVTSQRIWQIRDNLNKANSKKNDYLYRLVDDRRSISRSLIENDGWGQVKPIDENEREASLAMFDKNDAKFELAAEKSKKIMGNIETLITNFIREANRHVNVLNIDINSILTDITEKRNKSIYLKSSDFYQSSIDLVQLDDLKANISKMSNSEIADKIGDFNNLSEEEKDVIAEYIYGLSKSGQKERVLEIYTSFLNKYTNSYKNVNDICDRISTLVSFEITKKFIENGDKSNEEIERLVLIMKQNFEFKEFLPSIDVVSRWGNMSLLINKIKYDESGHLQVEYEISCYISTEGKLTNKHKFDGTNSMKYEVKAIKDDIINGALKEELQTDPDFLKVVFIGLTTIVSYFATGGIAIALTAVSSIDAFINIASELSKLTDEDQKEVVIDLMTLCGFVVGNESNTKYTSAVTQYVFFKLLEDPDFVEVFKNYLQAINDPNNKENAFEEYLMEFSDKASPLIDAFQKEIND